MNWPSLLPECKPGSSDPISVLDIQSLFFSPWPNIITFAEQRARVLTMKNLYLREIGFSSPLLSFPDLSSPLLSLLSRWYFIFYFTEKTKTILFDLLKCPRTLSTRKFLCTHTHTHTQPCLLPSSLLGWLNPLHFSDQEPLSALLLLFGWQSHLRLSWAKVKVFHVSYFLLIPLFCFTHEHHFFFIIYFSKRALHLNHLTKSIFLKSYQKTPF